MLKSVLTSVLAAPASASLSPFVLSCGPAAQQLQSVRWHRKPRWVPVARSKQFRVPERRKEDPEERAELMRLNHHYKTQVRAVRSYLFEEVRVHSITSSADHVLITPEEEAADIADCARINADWNALIAAERDQRLAAAMEARRAHIAERLERKVERERAALEEAERIVRREKQLSATFILKANLDAAIEHALANPVDYNYAIDVQGNQLAGRQTDEKDVQSVVANGQQQQEVDSRSTL